MKESRTVQVADLKHLSAPEFRFVHANNVNLAMNFYDVSLIFGEVTPDPRDFDADPVVQNRVAVTMSWEHARALSIALDQAVREYERATNASVRKRMVEPTAPSPPQAPE